MQNWLLKLLGQSIKDTPESMSLPELAAMHGIEIIADKNLTEIAVSHLELRKEHFKLAGSLLSSELAIYSPKIIKKSSLQRIILVSNLAHHSKKVGGLFRSTGNEIYLSLDQLGDANGARRGFHHELFHCIDYYDDTYKFQDAHWLTLNDRNFSYSPEWMKKVDALNSMNGFMTPYSMTAVWEDKAELYSHMIMHNNAVTTITKIDPILRKKTNRMLNLLDAFSTDYNGAFWDGRAHNSEAFKITKVTNVSLEVSWERVQAKSVYYVERRDTIMQHKATFDSYEKLIECLSLLGAADHPALQNFVGLKTFRVELQCGKARLVQFGLD